jgi:hypothetical protein
MIIDIKCKSSSPFLPEFCVHLDKVNIGSDLTAKLKDMALAEEKRIFETTTCPPHWDQTMLTSRLWDYNMFEFDYPALVDLKKIIAKQYEDYVTTLGYPVEKCYIHGWVNVLQPGQKIGPHNHADAHCGAPADTAYVSGNLCIQAENTKTYYSSPFNIQVAAGINNSPGDMYMFPSYIMHKTDVNGSTEPRVSLAFDIITEKVYNSVTTKIFVPLN